MTVNRLICAFYNISPSNTEIILVDAATKKTVWTGCWNDDSFRKHNGLTVLDFKIDKLSRTGYIHTLTAYTKKEETA